MRYIIFGAGGIGGTIGARLHMHGHAVTLIARGAHGKRLSEVGMEFVTVDGREQLRIPTVDHPSKLDIEPDDAVILAMKSQHTETALEDLRQCTQPTQRVVCAQNGVANERMALRRFENVYGMVVNLPALYLQPGQIITHAQGHGGILDTGRYPAGTDAWCIDLAAVLTGSGFSAEPRQAIMRQKYAKLLMNLGNAPQALFAEDQDLRELLRLLKHEAVSCFDAAGIDCASRDETSARSAGVYTMGQIEGVPRTGGSSWQSMMRGTGNIETDFLNGEIVLLGRLHGVPTPLNAAVQNLTRTMISEHRGIGEFTLDAIPALNEATE
jgi:2-dehydropantoate 2-reductase